MEARDRKPLAARARSPEAEIDPSGGDAAESGGGLPAAALAAHASGPFAFTAERRATDREIWALSWPVILSQVLASAVSLIDIAMVGKLDRLDVQAVGYATQYLNLTQAVLLGLGAACVALMAQARGAGDATRARHALAGSLAFTVAVSLLVTVVCLAIPGTLMGWLSAPQPAIAVGIPYFRLTLGSTLLFGLSLTLESGFRALGETRLPMAIALGVTVIKIALNAVLIFGHLGMPRLELAGAGLATLVSQAVGLIAFAWAARGRQAPAELRVGAGDFRAGGAVARELARLSAPAVAERAVLQVAMMTYFAVIGRFGAAAVAAYTIGIRILSFTWIPGTSFAVAAATLVGHAIGAGDDRRAARVGWRATLLSLVVSVVLGVFFALGRTPLARFFTPDEGIVRELGPFMLVLAAAQPLLGMHFTLAGALRGAGDTMTPFFAALVANWVLRVPVAYLASPDRGATVLWVWGALALDHLARAIWLSLAFSRGNWRKNAARAGAAAPP
ncbi:MAG: MATE family efflux transporter [bacterium]